MRLGRSRSLYTLGKVKWVTFTRTSSESFGACHRSARRRVPRRRPALTGHTRAFSPEPVVVGTDILHVLAGSPGGFAPAFGRDARGHGGVPLGTQPLVTRSLKAEPALNAGPREAGMLISAPVCGLRPVRAERSRDSNVPKPGSVWSAASPVASRARPC